MLPGYSLAQLDYTRDSPPEDRAELYKDCADAMATYPELQEQLLLRLQDDAAKFPASIVIDLLRRTTTPAPAKPYIALLNDRWRRLDGTAEIQALTELLADRWTAWPDNARESLDHQLTSALQASNH